jgi:antitoxin (DNA-binding transcriptional repressor) of toxin-antitoxin stability system
MIVIHIHEAKARLSEYLDKAAAGEQAVICKRNRPVAELHAVRAKRGVPRTIGRAKGIVIPPSFFEPMPDDWLDAFYNGPIVSGPVKPSRVAETQPTYGRVPRRGRKK